MAKSMAEGLTEYRNVVVCFATDGKDSTDTINGITVHRVKVNFSMMSQDVAFGYYHTLKRLMNEYEPQFVHVHCPNPYVYPLVLKAIHPETKLILHWHSDILSKGIVYKLIKPFENAILKRADLIVATSPNYIHPSSPIYPYKEKTDVVQNGMITADFDQKDGDDVYNWYDLTINIYDEVPTSIASVKNNAKQDNVMYNLAGQRIEKLQRGINIVNGKKVVIK